MFYGMRHRLARFLVMLAAVTAGASMIFAQDLSALKKVALQVGEQHGVEVKLDQSYADNSNLRQMVDVYLPEKYLSGKPLPVIAFIHGGGWMAGDRLMYAGEAVKIAKAGNYVVVAVGYRLSNEARWPAQIHDVKAAIRWIRGNAQQLNLDADRIAVWGASAGGHLCSLLGTSGDVRELEGSLGSYTSYSSRVTCVVNQCGPEDLTRPLMVTATGEPVVNDDAVMGLLGGDYKKKAAEAKAASPVTYVSGDDPPFLTIHGTADERVAYTHAETINAALENAGVESYLIPITKGGHGSVNHPIANLRAQFFVDKCLLGKESEVDERPVAALPARK